ncbi:pyridoxamine 5'-phosphate oxidase family protein [Actinocrispum wychmicini]|uniref:Uncharacterized protein YhbP (UPF0306 family) n=1 Tax=Actinocrispum wychmicini TaxID=1213861 RepID=A0A4R2JLX1_9PSEU|nr:pyridoxamine 5'-phosphate oxidase family protein [Actinocrispum wychmicini]TCO59602.1 uncharacterized protein YhbP (UPF0306 family) [Actinocrispum wychmicini]
MVSPDVLVSRSNVLIERGRFITLATHGSDGVWASTVNFVPLRKPLRLLWYSQRRVRHSRNVAEAPAAAGTIFLTGLTTELGLDGAQLTGTVRAVEDKDELAERAEFYYLRNFPDDQVRARWRLPLTEFRGAGHRRFYELTVTGWWLLDVDHWLATMNDQRVAVDLSALHRPPPQADR